MTIKDTERLLLLLRSHGVNHFKSNDVEVSFGVVQAAPDIPAEVIQIKRPSKTKGPAHGGAIPPVPSEIPHHVNEVKRLLKLNDEDLVNEMFPEGAPLNPEGE